MTVVLDRQIQQLLDSPRLPFIARKIDQVLTDEARRRREFYSQINEGDKAEFINGEAILHSPVKLRHNVAGKHLLVLLDAYVNRHDLGLIGYEKLMISLTRNDYEPDICFFAKERAASFLPDQMRFPAPDLVIEVLSASAVDIDRGVKFEDYAAHGVAEYWIVDPETETLEQYRLNESQEAYELVIKAMTGQVRSFVVAGFEIPVPAIFDQAENQAALQALLTSSAL